MIWRGLEGSAHELVPDRKVETKELSAQRNRRRHSKETAHCRRQQQGAPLVHRTGTRAEASEGTVTHHKCRGGGSGSSTMAFLNLL